MTASKQELMRNLQCTRNNLYLTSYAIALAHQHLRDLAGVMIDFAETLG